MRILGIVCSPRKGGNTEVLVREALASAKEFGATIALELIAKKKIAPCNGCESCMVTGKCKIRDDMQELYPRLLGADGIIFGSPVYYWGMTAQAKALLDRTFTFRKERPLRDKIVGLVVVAREKGASETFTAFVSYLYIQKMVLGGGVIAYADKRGDIRRNIKAMNEARELGKVMVRAMEGRDNTQRLSMRAPKRAMS
jgi:multimeric flavodoxin WrbA